MKTHKAPDVLLRQWLHSEDAITTLACIICALFLAISAWLIIRNLRHNEPGLKAPMVLPLAFLISLPGLYGASRLSVPWCFIVGILVCVGACVLFPFSDHRRYVRDQAGQIVADRWAIVLRFGGFSWIRDKANRHFFFSGDTGAGKTSGMNLLLEDLFRRNPHMGGVVMANKGDEWFHLQRMAAKYGRSQDIIQPSPPPGGGAHQAYPSPQCDWR